MSQSKQIKVNIFNIYKHKTHGSVFMYFIIKKAKIILSFKIQMSLKPGTNSNLLSAHLFGQRLESIILCLKRYYVRLTVHETVSGLTKYVFLTAAGYSLLLNCPAFSKL